MRRAAEEFNLYHVSLMRYKEKEESRSRKSLTQEFFLQYELAEKYHLKGPISWATNKITEEDKLYGFIKRPKGLFLRCAQATSLSRSTYKLQ